MIAGVNIAKLPRIPAANSLEEFAPVSEFWPLGMNLHKVALKALVEKVDMRSMNDIHKEYKPY
jgi:hypothetical protein